MSDFHRDPLSGADRGSNYLGRCAPSLANLRHKPVLATDNVRVCATAELDVGQAAVSWSGAARLARRQGWAYLAGALSAAHLTRLSVLTERLPTEPATRRVGKVEQRAEIAVLEPTDPSWDQGAADAAEQIAALIDDPRWAPNELTLMRYDGAGGISGHRDHVRYRELIVICSLWGSAWLDILAGRDDEVPSHRLTCRAGDVVVLRGAEPGRPDVRPLHRVLAPHGGRASVTFRMSEATEA